MTDAVSPERVRLCAQAARVTLEPGSAERVASAVSPTVERFAAEDVKLPLEIEPASFVAVQRGEASR